MLRLFVFTLLMVLYCLAVGLIESAPFNGMDGLKSLFGTALPPVPTKQTVAVTNTYKKTFPPPAPGQVQSAPCAFTKEGCCRDHRTRAPYPNGRGCGRLLCYDVKPGLCRFMNYTGELNCKDRRNSPLAHAEICSFTCKLCRPPAAPLERCLKWGPPHGCCWDGTPALGPKGKGCLPCRDSFSHPCKEFAKVSGGCHSGSYGIRTFMESYCPKTCGRCSRGF